MTVAFSPRGDVLASGSGDGTVRLWKVDSGQEQRAFEGHQGPVTRISFAEDGKTLISAGADNCVLIWDAAARGPVARGDPKAKMLGQRWADLAGDDAMVAFKAMGEMIAAPKEAVAFLATKLQPVQAADPAAISKLVEELDSKNFQAREKATKELQKLEGQARAALEKAYAKPPSKEAETRMKKLLDRLDGPVLAPEELRALRAIEVLERIGSPEARELLGRLAKGAPGARLTSEAKGSLARLTK